MSHYQDTASDFVAGTVLTIFALGWIDILWMFGVENSQQYTWWNVIHLLAN
jgi:exonuclease III